jgi:DNA replication and repair protein RecF
VPLDRVRIGNFRCIEEAELRLGSGFNYIFGPNGAGKTSILEAIFVLGRGRSFRTRQGKRLIRHGKEALTVYGEVSVGAGRHRAGVRLGSAGLESQVDGERGGGVAELARTLPTHVIEPNSHELIEGAPSRRRRFLDWGVFHVEPGFLDAWRRFRRALSQRNAALKSGQDTAAWDQAFIEAGEAVDSARSRYFQTLDGAVVGIGEALTGRRIALSYRSGWASGSSLTEALRGSAARDRGIGATQVGPHRADLGISMDDRGVREEASRGQQKLVAAALIIAQVTVFAQLRGDGGILLVDDPAAELDLEAFDRLGGVLRTLPAQLVLTGLSMAALPPTEGAPVFHVERGQVSSVV